MFKKLLDNTNPASLANSFRRKRFRFFLDFIKSIPRPVTILDVGGTADFWIQMGFWDLSEFNITILNLNEPEVAQHGNLRFIRGDAANLSEFSDKSFDVVFSNSVIEHIPTKSNRKKMANEICRVGKKYFVQTPSYYFPFDPHFLFPCFQYFPQSIKVILVKSFNMGWFKKCSSNQEALELLKYNSLLKKSELYEYFPNNTIIKEKFLFLTKSYIALNK